MKWFSKSQKDEDLEEIFLHVQQLKEEQNQLRGVNQGDLEPIDVIKDNIGQTAGEISADEISQEDVFEIIGPVDEDTLDPITKMLSGTSGICDMCGKEIVFEENLSGLVIYGRFFTCEKCCQEASKDALNTWSKSRLADAEDVRPIALWLMQEKDKDRLL
jgi:hypothetical protein